MFDIAVSLVLFHTDEIELKGVIDLINQSTLSKIIYLIDNSENDTLSKFSKFKNVIYHYNNKNVGYGSGHNVAFKMANANAKYHLIINSDIDFNPRVLKEAYYFMELNPEVGMLSPQIVCQDGELQYFCRKLPTPFDLFARRFIPKSLKPLFQKALDGYILLDHDYNRQMNIPNLPGCFMFIRTDKLLQVGGFDENIFMYCEDIDLTRRLHQISQTVYYPQITIMHQLARGSYKFTKLVMFHIKSAIYYFNKWGWFWDAERKQINKKIAYLTPQLVNYPIPEIVTKLKSAG